MKQQNKYPIKRDRKKKKQQKHKIMTDKKAK